VSCRDAFDDGADGTHPRVTVEEGKAIDEVLRTLLTSGLSLIT